jgi:hypothetical protein
VTDLAAEQQPLLWAISFAGMAAARACLAGVVSVYLDAELAGQMCFVDEQALQFSEGPLGGMPVGSSLLLAGLLAFLALGSLTDMGQVFQTNKTARVGVQNMLADSMVGVQLQPSLSPADGDTSPGRRASAFALESLLEAGVVVCFGSHFLSAVKLRPIAQSSNGSQVALAYIDAENLALGSGQWVRRLDGQADQQIEALPGVVIPEFGPADDGPGLNQGNVLVVALIGDMKTALKCEQAHVVPGPERVVMPIDVCEGGRDIRRRGIRALETAFGIGLGGGPAHSGGLWSTAPCRWLPPAGRRCMPVETAWQTGRVSGRTGRDAAFCYCSSCRWQRRGRSSGSGPSGRQVASAGVPEIALALSSVLTSQ